MKFGYNRQSSLKEEVEVSVIFGRPRFSEDEIVKLSRCPLHES